MKTIETQATLSPEGILTAKIPLLIAPGEHRVVIVIDETAETSSSTEAKQEPARFKLSTYPIGLRSDDFTFRREDL